MKTISTNRISDYGSIWIAVVSEDLSSTWISSGNYFMLFHHCLPPPIAKSIWDSALLSKQRLSELWVSSIWNGPFALHQEVKDFESNCFFIWWLAQCWRNVAQVKWNWEKSFEVLHFVQSFFFVYWTIPDLGLDWNSEAQMWCGLLSESLEVFSLECWSLLSMWGNF